MMGTPQDDSQATVWHGFACPRCHTLFRVPEANVGKRVECPACGEISLIPARNPDPAAPRPRRVPASNRFRTIAEVAGRGGEGGGDSPEAERQPHPTGPGGEGSVPTGKVRIRRKVKKKPVKPSPEPAWERQVRAARGKRSRSGWQRWRGSAVGAGILGLGTLAWIYFPGGKETSADLDKQDRPPASRVEIVAEDGESTETGREEVATAGVAQIEMRVALERIDASVATFLSATSVEEMARVVRGGAAMLPRMTAFYQRDGFAPMAYREIAPDGKVLKSGELWSVDVVLEDFTLRPIAVEATRDGYLVDWESWVGYSEMSWSEFVEKKPTTASLFRVLCAAVDYYNFDFQDDRAWLAYRLEAPSGGHTLYGYVPRFSGMGQTLGLGGESAEAQPQAFLMKLRYPKGRTSPNQVLIDEVVCSGWIAPP